MMKDKYKKVHVKFMTCDYFEPTPARLVPFAKNLVITQTFSLTKKRCVTTLITAAKETASKLTWFLIGREISKSRSCKKAGEKKS